MGELSKRYLLFVLTYNSKYIQFKNCYVTIYINHVYISDDETYKKEKKKSKYIKIVEDDKKYSRFKELIIFFNKF